MLSTWAISGAVGIDGIQAVATENPSGMIFDLAESSGGAWLSLSMQILVVTSFIAMLLGLSNMFSRYLFALGQGGRTPGQTVFRFRNRGARLLPDWSIHWLSWQ